MAFIKDLHGKYLFCNKEYVDFHGLNDESEIIGKKDEEIFSSRMSFFNLSGDESVIMNGESLKTVEYLKNVDGRDYWLEIIKSPLLYPDGSVAGVIGSYENITKKINYEDRINKKVSFEGALSNLATKLINVDSKNVFNVLKSSISEFSQILKIDHADIYFNDSSSHMKRRVAWSSGKNENDHLNLEILGKTEFKNICNALKSGRIYTISNINDDLQFEEKELLKYFKADSVVCVPMVYDDNVVGVGVYSFDDEYGFDEEIIEQLLKMTKTISYASVRQALGENLKVASAELEALFQAIPAYVYIKDSEHRFIRANKKYMQLIGCEACDLIGKTEFEVLDEEQAYITRNLDEKVLNENTTIKNFERKAHINDKEIWLSESKAPYTDKSGRVIGVAGVGVDISDKKLAEMALQESEARLNVLMSNFRAMQWAVDSNGMLSTVSGTLADYFGIDIHNLEGVKASDFIPIDEKSNLDILIEEALTGKPKRFECFNDGRWYQTDVEPLLSSGGNVIGAVGITVDLTEEVQTKEALQRSEDRYRVLVENLPIGIAVLDKNSNVTSSNSKVREWFDKLDFESDSCCINIFGEGYKGVFCSSCPGYLSFRDGKSHDKVNKVMIDGAERYFKLTSIPMFEDDEIDSVIMTYEDITEMFRREMLLKERQDELLKLNDEMEDRVKQEVYKNIEQTKIMIHQSRLAAMGEMIGNIAHQWRQPLNALTLNVFEMKYTFDSGDLTKKYMEQFINKVESIASKMSRTIDDFRNFYDVNKEREVFNVFDCVKSALNIIDVSYRNYNIELGISCEGDLFIVGFPNEYAQVILNILENAKDALIERKVAKPGIDISIYSEEDNVVLEITDNAGGIEEGLIERVFDPYFTTKDEGKGTGIGLYMSKMIIENNMNGFVKVYNTNKGVTFKVSVRKADDLFTS